LTDSYANADADSDDFARHLRQAYAEEAGEILTDLRKTLQSIDQIDPNAQPQTFADQSGPLKKLLSLLHSLKGAARAVSESQTVTICQALETTLSGAKKTEEVLLATQIYKLKFCLELVDQLLSEPDMAESEKEKIKTEAVRTLTVEKETGSDVFSSGSNAELQQASSASARETSSETQSEKAEISERIEKSDNLTSVRVPIERLDRLLSESEELLLVKARASEHLLELKQLKALVGELSEATLNVTFEERHKFYQMQVIERVRSIEAKINQVTKNAVRDGNTSAALINRYLDSAKTLVMLPVSSCFAVFPRMVRELNRELGKKVQLDIVGSALEADRRVLERLKDPLVHLLRNAMDHGIESEDERKASGKGQATITVSTRQLNGETIEITIEDNGRGIDHKAIRQTAIKKQLLSEEEADKLDIEELQSLIFRSDFSTRETISELSGRGLGLAIVKEKIEDLNGRLELTSKEGVGTTFRIILPSTLATFMGILIEANEQRFVVPLSGISRVIRVHPLALEVVDDRETFMVDGQVLPVASLTKAFNLPARQKAPVFSPTTSGRIGFKFMELLVLSYREKTAGVIVDQILNEQEFIVKKLGYPLSQMNNFAGVTILPDSSVALVLNVSDLVDTIIKTRFMQDQKPPSGLAAMLEREEELIVRRVLVVDDSVTARIFMRSMLEAAGYSVVMAVDGRDALKKLEGDEIDFVVSDVEMPVMDGLSFVKELRQIEKFKALPVVLVTSLAAETQRQEGLDAGANAYFVKGDFDQTELVDVLRNLA
jgi:two-component system chemotaxis sensor kinase CheA